MVVKENFFWRHLQLILCGLFKCTFLIHNMQKGFILDSTFFSFLKNFSLHLENVHIALFLTIEPFQTTWFLVKFTWRFDFFEYLFGQKNGTVSSHLLYLPNHLVEPCAVYTLPDDWDSFLPLGLLSLIITGLFPQTANTKQEEFHTSSKTENVFPCLLIVAICITCLPMALNSFENEDNIYSQH